MFEGLRTRWKELTGKQTRFAPPVMPDAEAATEVCAGLQHLRSQNAKRYARFCLFEQPLLISRSERRLFEALERCGLATRMGPSIYAPCARIFPLYGKLVATDLLSRTEPDQVFSLMFEQVYLVRNMAVRPEDRVLELCVGSGVNSLFAADTARRVIGVDLSERALAFARFNHALNGHSTKLELRQGSLFEPVASERFDLLLVNPPFELVPSGEQWFLHSDGGEDGLDVVRSLLSQAPEHLEPGGRVEMITWSPGSARGPTLVSLMREAFPAHRLHVDLLAEDPLEDHLDRFRDSPAYEGWRTNLEEAGIDRVFFLFLRAARDGTPGVEVHEPAREIADCHAVSDAWV